MSDTEQSKPVANDETANEASKSVEVEDNSNAAKNEPESSEAKPRTPRGDSHRVVRGPTKSEFGVACRMLRGWPAPCEKHITALNQFFERTIEEHAVRLDELDRRAEFIRAVETDADASLLHLHLVGTARSGFALRSDESVVLIELTANEGKGDTEKSNDEVEKPATAASADGDDAKPKDTEDAKAKQDTQKTDDTANRKRSVIERIADALTRRGCEVAERSDEHLLARQSTGSVTYRIRFAPTQVYLKTAIENASLLRHYASVDSRCYALGTLMAQLSSTLHLEALDETSSRRGPPASSVRDQISTLTVYYLQKVKSILPCLHELVAAASKSEADGEKRERAQVPSVSEWTNVDELVAAWRREREDGKVESLAELFLGLLSFLAFDFDPLASVVSLSSLRTVWRRSEGRGWSSELAGFLFVEDACRPTTNICTALRKNYVWRALENRLIAAFRYFATPVIRHEGQEEQKITRLFDNVLVEVVQELRADVTAPNASEAEKQQDSDNQAVTEKQEGDKQEPEKQANDAQEAEKQANDKSEPEKQAKQGQSEQKRGNPREKRVMIRRVVIDSEQPGWYSSKLLEKLNESNVSLVYDWSDETILSHFPVASLRPTAVPVVAERERERESGRRGCELCRHDHGPSTDECPVAKRCVVERNVPLAKNSRAFLLHVSDLVFTQSERCVQTDREIDTKQKVIDDVFAILSKSVHPNTRVDVFGSCANGFEYRGSDMDLCVTFGEIRESPKRDWQVDRLRKIAKILDDPPRSPFRVIRVIDTARVPIIKFRHKPTQVFGDICLYNVLALENTALMRTYCNIDTRVQVLGAMLKSLVRHMRINDASQRTLSSYAYLNMLVYFLQRCDPPVLPVLQELYDGTSKNKSGKQNASAPKRLVDGKNVWFQSNMEYIRSHFNVNANTKTFAQLWIEFLHYYSHKFDFLEYVVAIRQLKPLTKSEKKWTQGRNLCLAIEDPFELSHNLGDVLSPESMARILGVFRCAYQLYTDEAKFNEALKDQKMDYRSLHKYFFKLDVPPLFTSESGDRVAPERERERERRRRIRKEAAAAEKPKKTKQKPKAASASAASTTPATNGDNNAEKESKATADEDEVHVGVRNDAEENDAFDSAQSSPNKSGSGNSK